MPSGSDRHRIGDRMGRWFSFDVTTILALANSVPARAWPWLEHAKMESLVAREDTTHRMEQGEHLRSLTSKLRGHERGNPSAVWKAGRTTDQEQILESDGSYLNGLVQATAESIGNEVANVAFVKTHKTASTTVASIMYRFAVRHGLKVPIRRGSLDICPRIPASFGANVLDGLLLELAYFGDRTSIDLESAAAQTRKSGDVVDIMHYHLNGNGKYGKYEGSWDEAVGYYREIMRHPDDINFVTVLREPRSHFLSYYYYYMEPANKLSIEEFLFQNGSRHNELVKEVLANPLSSDFGLRTPEDMDSFIQDHLPSFKLVLLTERLAEGLIVLRRMLSWHLIDLTYCDLNETKPGRKRWDGKSLINRPDFESLPKKVQQKIDELTDLDRRLYDSGKRAFEERLAPYADSMKEDMALFQRMQSVVTNYLEGNSSSRAYSMYQRERIAYEEPLANVPF